ncbi:MAG: macrolide ABC transporter ATP-binding protein [Betaproteobacteria bacterium TMED156]|nr:MAG: macrolide ABC transporter ATP-binding protein [Betaproteobacteria bacterium TMED156]
MTQVLNLKNLSKSYFQSLENTVPVIDDLNLQVEVGEFLSLMGPSGSGKSTLLNLIGLLDQPNSGEIYFDGQNLTKLKSDEQAFLRNHEFGFVFQGFNLLKRMSILENVALPLLYQGVSRHAACERAKFSLESTGLKDLEARLPNQLSGGQQQRVAIARALVVNPRIILADEPTGNLDTNTAREIMKTFVNLNSKKDITIILVTHEAEIAEYGNRVIKMRDGKIISDEKIN